MEPFTTKSYAALRDRLQGMADEKYRKFHEKLIPGVTQEFWGIRVPALRKTAKEILKGDWRDFLASAEEESVYELTMLSGLVLAGAKCDFEEKLERFTEYIPRIDNWAVCDIVCGEFKEVKKNRERTYAFLQPYLNSSGEYERRFALVLLMQHYLVDEWIDRVLAVYSSVRLEDYYVKMAVAWGLSVCFVKYREKTLAFFRETDMESWTYNKALQKTRESYRVTQEDKEMLKGMKR